MMMLLSIDIDGVLRAFTEYLTIIYQRIYPDHKIAPKVSYDMNTWFPIGREIWDFTYKEHVIEIFENAPIYNGALEMLIKMEAEGHYIQLVTAQPKRAIRPTLNWVRKHDLPFRSIHFESQKWLVWTDLLLDDCMDNLEDIEKKQVGAWPTAFDQPWNKGWSGSRIKRHSEIFEIINMIKEFKGKGRHQRGYA